MFSFRFFGVGQAQYGNRILVGFPNQQAFQFLAYLILNRNRQHSREQLSALFWAEHSSDKARKNLRHILWRLRKSFESVGAFFDDYILVQDSWISFKNSKPCFLDIEEFDAATTKVKGTSGVDFTTGQANQLEEAIKLYDGDLLESIYEDWCLYERERFRLGYLNALVKLMDFHGIHGHYNRGLYYGQKLLEFDPTREKIHRNMMVFYWCKGDRNAAFNQYKLCYQTLHEELGLEPMDETQWLYQQILQNNSQPERWNPNLQQIFSREPSNINDEFDKEYLLNKIQMLQSMVEDFGNELRSLKHMLKEI